MVSPAGAADLLVKAPPPAPVPAWSWTVQLMGFGTRDLLFVGVPAASGNFTEDVRENINMVKAGINYRFH
jgi:hypothetical protein